MCRLVGWIGNTIIPCRIRLGPSPASGSHIDWPKKGMPVWHLLSEAGLAILFAAHLVAVNLGAAGPLLSAWLCLRALRRRDPVARSTAYRLAIVSVGAAAVGMTLGALLLLVHWYDPHSLFLRGMERIAASRYVEALLEIVFYFAMMAIVIGLWPRLETKPLLLVIPLVLAATDLLFHFPPLMVVIASVPHRTDLAGAVIDGAVFRRLLFEPEVASRVIHSWLASVAVAGCAMMMLAVQRDGAAEASVKKRRALVRWGAMVALGATLLQPLAGMWLLLHLRPAARYALLGGSVAGTALLAAGLAASLALVHLLLSASLAPPGPRRVLHTALTLLLVVVLMAATLHRTKRVPPSSLRPAHRKRPSPTGAEGTGVPTHITRTSRPLLPPR